MLQAFSTLILAFSTLIGTPGFTTNATIQNQAWTMIPQIHTLGAQVAAQMDVLSTSTPITTDETVATTTIVDTTEPTSTPVEQPTSTPVVQQDVVAPSLGSVDQPVLPNIQSFNGMGIEGTGIAVFKLDGGTYDSLQVAISHWNSATQTWDAVQTSPATDFFTVTGLNPNDAYGFSIIASEQGTAISSKIIRVDTPDAGTPPANPFYVMPTLTIPLQ